MSAPHTYYNEFKQWLSFLENKFSSIWSLFIIYFFLFLFIGYLLHPIIRDKIDYETIIYLIIYVFITLYWLWYRLKYPKNDKRKTGLIISIHVKNIEEARLKDLFIRELKRCINNSGLHKIFKIIVLKNHLAEKVKNPEDINELHKKIKGHMYFYGDVQKEPDGRDEKYFLTIDGCIKHAPIPIPACQRLSFDFRTLLPQEINFISTYCLRGCRATADIVYLTTKYMVGIASFLSGNPFLALRLHGGLEDELLKKYHEIETVLKSTGSLTTFNTRHLEKIRKQLPQIISLENQIISGVHYNAKEYKEAEKFIEQSLLANPRNYGALMKRTLYDFTIDKDPHKALLTIEKARKQAKIHGGWRYNKAFLLFWLGDFKKAWKECQKIVENSYFGENITLKDVEKFNVELLKTQEDKPQLYFWLGYLQYKKVGNIPRAFDFFTKFIEKTKNINNNGFNFLVIKTNSFLDKLKKEMHIT